MIHKEGHSQKKEDTHLQNGFIVKCVLNNTKKKLTHSLKRRNPLKLGIIDNDLKLILIKSN